MCFGGNDAAEQARIEAERTRRDLERQEEERRQKIKTGQASIDTAFAQFNDPYFAQFRQDYIDSRNPEIDNQYATAKDKLIAALAGRGVLRSTIGANALGDLDKKLGDVRGQIANEAFDMSNSFRDRVEKTKSDLYSLNTASADPDMIAARAQGETTALIPPQSTTPLGDLFGSILAPIVNYSRAAIYSPTGRSGFSSPPTSGAGNGRVYG